MPPYVLLPRAIPPPRRPHRGGHAFTIATFSYRRISWASNLTLLGSACLLPGAVSVALTSNASDGIGASSRSPSASSSRRPTGPPPRRKRPSAPPSPSTSRPLHPTYGDGLAFILTSSQSFLGASNGYLGLYPSDAGDVSTVAVEFDTYRDVELGDPDSNHVALNAGSIFSVASASPGVDLRAGVPITAWVVALLLTVPLAEEGRALRKHRLIPISPGAELMYAGFSASNREGTAVHVVDVKSWIFRIVDPPKTSSKLFVFTFSINSSISRLHLHRPRMTQAHLSRPRMTRLTHHQQRNWQRAGPAQVPMAENHCGDSRLHRFLWHRGLALEEQVKLECKNWLLEEF